PSSGSAAATPSQPPAPAAAASPSLPPGTPPDSAARLRALLDSAAALDASFQRERAALNADAVAMAALDRRSGAYAERFDAFRVRQAAAERQREARDQLRRRAERMRARLAERAAAAPR
ncbi:MAG TPA: hypothetical protein VKA84_01495, partial [Gemmatimonadaceae bacterium]|nr:hypothetical protein [Gemmatimonadaceae bacterium]